MNPIFRGDNKTYNLAFTDDNGDAIPINGWKIYFTMKRKISQSDNDTDVLKVDVTSHDDPENGKTSIHLSNGKTNGLKPGTYFYDIQIKKSEDDILTIMSGKIKVLADITRRED